MDNGATNHGSRHLGSVRVRRWLLGGLGAAAAVAAIWWFSAGPGPSDSSTLQSQVLAVASQLRAPGDHNTMTVATSSLPQAQHMRYEIQQALLAGETADDVKRMMVQEYGVGVLAAPPVRGWGSLVWVLPAVAGCALLCGALRYVFRHAASVPSGCSEQRGDGAPAPAGGCPDVEANGADPLARRLREFL
ncbi:MAG: cytochrome c-type biogenesis protein CcmH [Alicyclobacillaceae bacterium]|nr:cytochrome c-type biogenesis protein CcmH [Alicyclobacillaceae bacterium]